MKKAPRLEQARRRETSPASKLASAWHHVRRFKQLVSLRRSPAKIKDGSKLFSAPKGLFLSKTCSSHVSNSAVVTLPPYIFIHSSWALTRFCCKCGSAQQHFMFLEWIHVNILFAHYKNTKEYCWGFDFKNYICLFVFITNKEISSHIKFAEFTWRPARLRICCKQCFAKFVKFLQTQQLSKLCNILRETGDLLCNLPKKLPILVTVYRIFKNFICFLSIKCLLLS